jgi:filamentous hemagglutinin
LQSAAVQVGTTVSGNTVGIQSGKDLAIRGSSVAGTGDVTLAAGSDVSIQAATNLRTRKSYDHVREGGLLSGGSFGITLGTREQTDLYEQQATTQSRSHSLVGSTGGSLSIVAGNQARVSGSDLAAGQDVSLAARTVTLDPGQDRSQAHESHDFSQSGLTLAVSSPVLSAAQTIQTMKEAAIESRDPRVRALAAATAGLAAKNAYDAVSADPKAAGGATLSLTYGESRSHSESDTEARTTAGSLVRAGRNVSITAAGGDLSVVGSTVQGENDVALKAAGNLNLVSSQDMDTTSSRSSSSGWSAGAAATYGSQGTAFGLTASASRSHGNSNGSDTAQANTHIIAGNKASLASGGDTNLKGAVVSASQVSADAGGNLNIESLQDTSTCHSQDSNTGGSLTVGAGLAASVNLGRQRMNSDYASVTEQSGIQAGDGGFQVNVKGNTDLKGAVIASTDKAVGDGKNTLTTGSLTMSDLQNKAHYDAKGSSVTFGGQTATNPFKAPTGDAKGPLSVTPLTGGASAQLQGDASGITRSGISGIAGNASVRTGDAAGGVGRIFNAGDVQKQLNAQVTVTQTFNQLAPVAARD